MNFRLAVERVAISSPNPNSRALAVNRLIRERDISALINVLGARYEDSAKKAQFALDGYSWK